MDDYYILDESNYSKEILLSNYDREETPSIDWDRADKNIENILHHIVNNPDIQFYLFMPPYSILFWDQYNFHDCVNNEIQMHRKIIESFLPYDNVKLFYFMTDEEIITNFDNYRDAGHYSPKVCKILVDKMYRGENLVTEDNYMDILQQMEQLVQNYDYDKIFVTEEEIIE